MAFNSETSRDDYTGNGAANEYDYNFQIEDESHLRVFIRDDEGNQFDDLVLDTDYSVSGVGNGSGGSITLLDDGQDWIDASGFLESGYELSILKFPPLNQPTSIRNQKEFFPEVHEKVFDRLTGIAQRLNDAISRSLKLPETISDSGFDPTIPSDVDQLADRIIIVNEDRDGFEMADVSQIVNVGGALAIANNLSDLASVATALSNLGIKPLSQPTTTAITNGMSATTIYTFTPGSWVEITYFIIRDSGTVLGSGTVSLYHDGTNWNRVIGPYRTPDGKTLEHGLTFSMSGNDFRVAADSSGAGSLITKYHSA